MATTETPQPGWRRMAGIGFEFFAVVAGLVLLGTWIDRYYDTSPRGVLICAILGIVGGLYNLIHSALKTMKSFDPPGSAGGSDRDRE